MTLAFGAARLNIERGFVITGLETGQVPGHNWPSPVIVPPEVVQRYLIGLPSGETAFALSSTFGPPASVHAVTVVGLDDRLSVNARLAEVTMVCFLRECLLRKKHGGQGNWRHVTDNSGALISGHLHSLEISNGSYFH